MKSFLFIAFLLSAIAGKAQMPARHVEVTNLIPAGEIINEKAVETLVARNVVVEEAQAIYQAGQSIILKPGFEAQSGAIFLAAIAPTSDKPSAKDLSNLTLRALPNPFTEYVTIEYSSLRSGQVLSKVVNGNGQIVQQHKEELTELGVLHYIKLDAQTWPTGVYYFQLHIGQESKTLKLIRK